MHIINNQNKTRRPLQVLVRSLLFIFVIASCSIQAAIIGQTGNTFNLTASDGYISIADGGSIYSWGYSIDGSMQLPGPTLIVNEGDQITVTLNNALPSAAGNVSIVFPGHLLSSTTGGVQGALTQEAAIGGSVTYVFTAGKPGTYQYHSGTRSELQVEMGLYGALIVRPATVATGCTLSAYNHSETCYDREYLFLLSEIDVDTHRAAEAQASGAGPINIGTGEFTSEYWMINGRAAPDTMAAAGTSVLPHQPYNAMTRMHPGERLLMRVIGVGREFHPFHFHGNHARIIARDGNLLVSETDPSKLAGPKLFTIPSVPGTTTDAIFEWTGKGLGWDIYDSKKTSIAVANAGFEQPTLADLGFLDINLPAWSKTGDGRIFNPSNNSDAPQGSNIYLINGSGSVSQTLAATLTAGSYTLNVAVADRVATANAFGNYMVELGVDVAGVFTPLPGASESALVPNNQYLTSTIIYDASSSDPLIGSNLAIRLSATSTTPGFDVVFDDVQLDYIHSCIPDADGFNSDLGAVNYREWCADHGKPIPVQLPALSSLAFGGFYSGSPYLGVVGSLPPGEGGLNPGAGFSYMWHSHTEREMVNNDIFPGGMMTMLIIEDYNVDITEFGGDKP